MSVNIERKICYVVTQDYAEQIEYDLPHAAYVASRWALNKKYACESGITIPNERYLKIQKRLMSFIISGFPE